MHHSPLQPTSLDPLTINRRGITVQHAPGADDFTPLVVLVLQVEGVDMTGYIAVDPRQCSAMFVCKGVVGVKRGES